MENSYGLLDLTVYGRQEIAQWSRLKAAYSDDLGTAVPGA